MICELLYTVHNTFSCIPSKPTRASMELYRLRSRSLRAVWAQLRQRDPSVSPHFAWAWGGQKPAKVSFFAFRSDGSL